MLNLDDSINLLKEHVREYPDFPKPGIVFRDIFPLFQDPTDIVLLRDVLLHFAKEIQPSVDCIVGLDARGFLIGPLLAIELNVPFIPVRKSGKLPGKCVQASYSLEYGEDVLEIQNGSIKPGQNVLIVDDLLATGGTLKAACALVNSLEAQVVACLVFMELSDLKGRCSIPTKVISVVTY